MATLLDLGLVRTFDALFPFLFVFVVVYGVLSYTKLLGENKSVHAIIAFILAIAALFSRIALKTITLMAPWFVILFVFAIFAIMTYQLFGVKEEEISGLWKNWTAGGSTIFYWLLALILMIGLGSLFTVLREERAPPFFIQNATVTPGIPEARISFWSTVFHPKVLGAALLFLIALFAIKSLTELPKK